ncbi:MAG: DUF5681 domain-containing protein [Nitrospinaceae bacterium]|jgi:hypothetical protein|nr:DUF5681 domain-containing protein [Nitrospinaceae bacterium]|tara:strand:+ start:691 stop:1023 length:333 start_codon:yes stop_codon:yes gene_type:complete
MQTTNNHLWKPGESGNPKGRPKGSRNKLSEAVIGDILMDWEEHGVQTIIQTREKDPVRYLRVVAGIIPREFQAKSEIEVSFIDALKELNNRENKLLDDRTIDVGGSNESD